MPAERLQKLLARAGIASRRAAEALITEGRVTVDGVPAHLGERADPATQRIEVDGKPLALGVGPLTLVLNKPAGILVTANDERGRRTVFDILRRSLRDLPPGLTYIGRLDRDSEGLLLLTTDGELAHRLAHPRYHVPRTYEAWVAHPPSKGALAQLRDGVDLEEGRTAPARVSARERNGRHIVALTLHEGRKRQVRRMLRAVGHPVQRLVRTRFGPLELGSLAPGAARTLSPDEASKLYALVGLDGTGTPTSAVDAATRPLVPLRRARTDEASPMTDAPAVSDVSDVLERCVTIDGPTASGKSVVGRALADRLGFGFFDTGLMYRACTLAVLNRAVDPNDIEAVTALIRTVDLDVSWPAPTKPLVRLEGQEVSKALRTPEIEANVSLVSRIPEVRDELVRRQRAFAAREPLVMVGRDIGTRVLTEARTKIFLEASAEVRARRRLGEELDSGRDTSFERVLSETRRRDELDATGYRAIRREQAAPDALVIDTDAFGIEQVVARCIEHYEAMSAHDPGQAPGP